MSKLKEKTFGFLVVIALGVIFIPMLFESDESVTSNKQTPVAPKSLEKPVVVEQLKSDAKHSKNKPQFDELKPLPEPLPAPVPKSESKPLPEPLPVPVPKSESKPLPEPLPESLPVPVPKSESKPVPVPKSESKPLPEPKAEPALTETDLQEPDILAEPKKAPKERKEKPIKATGPSGWVIQMGAFAEHQNAKKLVQRLQSAGYPVFTKFLYRHGRQITVVMVGPYVSRNEPLKLQCDLESRFHLYDTVIRYESR